MSFFGTTVKQPKEKKSLGNISADQLNSNQQAVPIAYLAGRRYLAGQYISPAYNQVAKKVEQTTGKDETSTVGYIYYCDFALVFCMGGRRPVDAIYTVIVDSEIVWQGAVVRGGSPFEDITVTGYGQLRIYWGSTTQPIDPTLLTRGAIPADPGFKKNDKSTWPTNEPGTGQTVDDGQASGDPNPLSGHYDGHPAYRGQCYGVFTNWKLGRDRTQIPNIQVELKRGVPFISGAQLDSDDRGVNIIGFLYDALTDDRTGAGIPEAKLLISSWTATRIALDSFRVSVLVTNQEELRSTIARALEYCDGWLRRNGTLLEVGFWSHGAININTLPVITDDDLDGKPELKPLSFDDTVNRVRVQYQDRAHHYNDRLQEARDGNNRRIVGMAREAVLQRPWITDAALATQYAAEYRTIHAQPSVSGSLSIKRESLTTKLGGLPCVRFKWNSSFLGLSIVCRLQEIEWPEDRATRTKCTIETERGLWPQHYVAPPVPGDDDFKIGPAAITRRRIVELPGGLKPQGSTVLQIAALAHRVTTEVVGFKTWVSSDGGATYDLASDKNNFAAYGTLVLPPFIRGSLDLRLWLKADSLSLNDGDPVTTWTDGGLYGYNVTQSDSTKKPIFKRGVIRGMPVVRFDGVNDYLRSVNGPFNGEHTIFAVFSAAAQTGVVVGWGAYVDGKARTLEIWNGGAGSDFNVYYSGYGPGAFLNTGVPAVGYHVSSMVIDASNNISAFNFGRPVGTANLALVNQLGTTGFTVGASPEPTPSFFLSGDIAEILIFAGGMGVDSRKAIEDYLATKYWFEAQVRLFGVDLDTVQAQSAQQLLDNNLLLFLDDEIMAVGNIVALGGGLYNLQVNRNLYGTGLGAHAADAPCYFIFRRKIIPIENENFVPGTTRHFKLQPFTHLQDYDLTAITPIGYTFKATPPIPVPALSPSSSTFVTSIDLDVVIPTGYTARYTTDFSDVVSTSRIWPTGGITLIQSAVISVRLYAPNGAAGKLARGVYTRVSGTASGGQTCGAVSFQFSGAQGRTSGTLTLRCATPSSTIKYSKNGAAFATYSAPLGLVVDDTVETYAQASGSNDSAHSFFDNARTLDDSGGGNYGDGGGGGHHNEP
jgi:hypothetical protein